MVFHVTLTHMMYRTTRLCDLSHFDPVKNLERLYLGMNRIQDYSELEKLGCLLYLIELSIISNPVSLPLSLSFPPSLPLSLPLSLLHVHVHIVHFIISLPLSLSLSQISRRMQHRSLLIYRLPSLQSLDGVMVTTDERHTAEATFSDRCQQVCTRTFVLVHVHVE